MLLAAMPWPLLLSLVLTEAIDPRLAPVAAGSWEEFAESQLVLALHEPIFYAENEDEHHPRLLAFADGRVLYRVQEDGIWQWYVARLAREEVDALRRSVIRDLARTPKFFSCSAATHQRRSIIVVRRGAGWRVREGYGLSACVADVAPDFVPSSSHPVPMPAPDGVPAGFLRAYRRLRGFRGESPRPWFTPRLSLLWIPQAGPTESWPEMLPAPRLPKTRHFERFPVQALDGRFDRAVRRMMPLGGRFEIDGEPWIAQVQREQPGDATFECAWSRPRRLCLVRRRHAKR